MRVYEIVKSLISKFSEHHPRDDRYFLFYRFFHIFEIFPG